MCVVRLRESGDELKPRSTDTENMKKGERNASPSSRTTVRWMAGCSPLCSANSFVDEGGIQRYTHTDRSSNGEEEEEQQGSMKRRA